MIYTVFIVRKMYQTRTLFGEKPLKIIVQIIELILHFKIRSFFLPLSLLVLLHNVHHFRKPCQCFFFFCLLVVTNIPLPCKIATLIKFDGKFHAPGTLFSTLREWHSYAHLFYSSGNGYISVVKEVNPTVRGLRASRSGCALPVHNIWPPPPPSMYI